MSWRHLGAVLTLIAAALVGPAVLTAPPAGAATGHATVVSHACTQQAGRCIHRGERCPRSARGRVGWSAAGHRLVCRGAGPRWRTPVARSGGAATHACTTTSSGTCIRGGEFCPKADYGQTGYDAHGTAYVCQGDSTHPHWE